MARRRAVACLSAVLVALFSGAAHPQDGIAGKSEVLLDVSKWQVVRRESGPVNYYRYVNDPVTPYIRSEYRPPLETVVLGTAVAEADRARARKLRWKWRAVVLPQGGDECRHGTEDSAAVVYVSWKRGLRWYALKYVWSSVGPKGWTCGRKRNPFVAQDTIVLESGSPLNVWKEEEIDLYGEFRKHFADNDATASVPDFVGIGIMSDGDQTQSASSADFADFRLSR